MGWCGGHHIALTADRQLQQGGGDSGHRLRWDRWGWWLLENGNLCMELDSKFCIIFRIILPILYQSALCLAFLLAILHSLTYLIFTSFKLCAVFLSMVCSLAFSRVFKKIFASAYYLLTCPTKNHEFFSIQLYVKCDFHSNTSKNIC